MPSTYHQPSKAPETAWARHIDRFMRREGWSQTRAFRAARQALGLAQDSRSAFLPYLVGREPDEDQAKALATVFGWPDPEEELKPPAGPTDPLIAALSRQAAAIEQLVARIDQLIESRDQGVRDLAEVLAEAIAGQRSTLGRTRDGGTPGDAAAASSRRNQ